ncbi:MAG: signal peptidase I [Pseudobacter sp.]|uniref:signal peptidase I n=1 Tax=Pseudobacter sp. TaxID=2045420 RepID=UPI003F7CE43C
MKHQGLKKLFPYLIIILLLIVSLLIIRTTGAIQLRIADNNYCRPSISQGTIIAISAWKKPAHNDFICFYNLPIGFMDDRTKGVLRLAGLPGDTIEIRNGELFVNDMSADKNLDLVKEYGIPKPLAERTLKLLRYDTLAKRFENRADSFFLQLVKKDLLKLEKEKIPYSRRIAYKNSPSQQIVNLFQKNWDHDHFGPYIVPPGHYFLLGDNRNQCLDSRDFGPLPVERLIGTVLNH